MAARLLLAALVALLLLAACGEERAPAPPATAGSAATTQRRAATPALCERLRSRVVGRVRTPAATEISGLALSRRRPGILWMHNDSGDRARVLATRTDGTPVADLDVPGARAVDWEDLAIGPDPAGGDALFLADIGDNTAARPAIEVYRVPEPAASNSGVTARATRLVLRYPDGPHDAETLLVEPRTGELAIVTKTLGGGSAIYVARRPSAAATTTLRRVARLELGLGGAATAGDVSADGRVVVVRTYTGLVAWAKRPGEPLARALRRRPCSGAVSLAGEGQGESLALTAGGTAFFTVPEGASPAIRRFSRR